MSRWLFLLALVAASFGWGVSARAEQLHQARQSEQVQLDGEAQLVAVLASRSVLAQARRAPLVERLPVVVATRGNDLATASHRVEAASATSGGATEPCLQIRRRLPRMGSDEPPWS